jgi:hypothetical protein
MQAKSVRNRGKSPSLSVEKAENEGQTRTAPGDADDMALRVWRGMRISTSNACERLVIGRQ